MPPLVRERRRQPLGRLFQSAGALMGAGLAGCSPASTPWPAGEGRAIPVPDAQQDLSAASWNPESRTLWVARQNGRVSQLRYAPDADAFELLRSVELPPGVGSDLEALTQVDFSAADELYTLAEDQGRLARVVDLDTTPTLRAVWNLETPSRGVQLPAEKQGRGAEGLEFVPDAALLAAGFRYPDGSAFRGSTKGMGGLIFVGHQTEGRLHVFDVDPDVSDDFVNHGSFRTSAEEIAGLHYDRASGLMFLWHNTADGNSLELSTLSSDAEAGSLDVFATYAEDVPEGNLEGIAVADADACGALGGDGATVFITRDGEEPSLAAFHGFPCGWRAPTVRGRVLWLAVAAVALLGALRAWSRRGSIPPTPRPGGNP